MGLYSGVCDGTSGIVVNIISGSDSWRFAVKEKKRAIFIYLFLERRRASLRDI
jgi:hypothetical protein